MSRNNRDCRERIDIRIRLLKNSREALMISYLSKFFGDSYNLVILQTLCNYWLPLAQKEACGESISEQEEKEIRDLGRLVVYSLLNQIHLICSVLKIEPPVVLAPIGSAHIQNYSPPPLSANLNSSADISVPVSTNLDSKKTSSKNNVDNWNTSIEVM